MSITKVTVAMRPNKVRRIVAVTVFGGVLATGVGWGIGEAKADPGCETILWGFLGSQRRTICDGPILADGSWIRARVVSVPAHQVPFRCYYSSYSSTCSGGYFVDESIVSVERYPVTPDTVLPDEPGHLAATGGYVA